MATPNFLKPVAFQDLLFIVFLVASIAPLVKTHDMSEQLKLAYRNGFEGSHAVVSKLLRPRINLCIVLLVAFVEPLVEKHGTCEQIFAKLASREVLAYPT